VVWIRGRISGCQGGTRGSDLEAISLAHGPANLTLTTPLPLPLISISITITITITTTSRTLAHHAFKLIIALALLDMRSLSWTRCSWNMQDCGAA
jgi:hypothetical protein